MILKQFYFHS